MHRVKRYETDKGSCGHTMWEHPEGTYVTHADYMTLQIQAAQDADDAARWRAFRTACAEGDDELLGMFTNLLPGGDVAPKDFAKAMDTAMDAARNTR